MLSIYCYNVAMKYGFKYSLNVKDYSKNAAKNFSITRLIIYTLFSLFLTIMLLITSIQYKYEGKALFFTGIAFVLIFGYTILNIKALIIKLKK